MHEESFARRFLAPLSIVIIPLIISFIIYFNSWRIDNNTLQQIVAMVSGLSLIAAIFFGPLAIYPISFFRGAKPAERIVACLVVPILFDVYEIYVLSGVFTFAESLYYTLNPTHITIFLLAFGFMGICEIICRWIVNRQGKQIRILTAAPIMAFVVMLFGLYLTLLWGNGAHLFYIYVDSYLALFVR